MTRSAFLVLLASCSLTLAEHNYGICNVEGCECTPAAHPFWMMINCTLPSNQKLNILEGDLPEMTSDLLLEGCEAITLGANSLSRLKDLRRVRLSGAQLVVLRRGTATNLNVVNAFLEIDNCHELRIEEKTFSNIRGPLTVTINNCDYVSMEGDAFSWLLKISISNAQNLSLSTGTFTLDPTAANVGEHGPGMSIELRNATVPEFPANTFGSSAAEILMDSVVIGAVRAFAFSANTYNVVKATDCSFDYIEGEAFAQNSLINSLQFHGCKLHHLRSKALQSAVTKLDIANSRFDFIEPGAINATVASVRIADSEFHTFMARGFELSSWNKLYMGHNKFDSMAANAIIAPTNIVHELFFVENEIESVATNSLGFIGQVYSSRYAVNVVYKNNYYGVPCHCNISLWLAEAMGSPNGEPYETESYCTVDEFFARCFNEPEQNLLFKKFTDVVCSSELSIQCEKYKTKTGGKPTEIKNPRFPHKKEEESLSDKDKKVIGIVIVTALGCVIIVMFISFIRCMKRRGYCTNIKIFLMSSNSTCGSLCERLCVCGRNNGLDNALSISRFSVNEYSERRCLNEPRVQEIPLVLTAPPVYSEEVATPMDDKATQTLPEELTKELLENLKEKLEDPENYVEAREMIEHLYELIKVEESCNTNNLTVSKAEENIYDLPFQNTTPRIGKNKKQMISIGTKTPSLDKLAPLSPYNRQTALAHEYFEPKDFAVHLYAEIANCDKEKRSLLGNIPDIVEQVVPRGPYLRAIHAKNSSPGSSPQSSSSKSPSSKSFSSISKTPISSPTNSFATSPLLSPSTSSGSSGKMVNRPLPEKPVNLDAGEGTSAAMAFQV
ncbi:unnamed protein product [Chilo suppressalis]|uniref:Uncharacterized protein n=1 Tax=Chilo suppressalis TaxID=168631 RepID=A0ABN8EFA7_CHISP|nr:unnamed protein product [Chilo suppressalis]